MKKTFLFGQHMLGAWAILLMMAMGMSSCSEEEQDNGFGSLIVRGTYELDGFIYDDVRVWHYLKLEGDANWTATLVETQNGKKLKSVGNWKMQNSGKEILIYFKSGDRSGHNVVLTREETTYGGGISFTVEGVKYDMRGCKTKTMEEYMNSGDVAAVDFSAFCGTWSANDVDNFGALGYRVWKQLTMNADNTFQLTETEEKKELQSSGTWRTANNGVYLILEVTGGEGNDNTLVCDVRKGPQTEDFELEAPSTSDEKSNTYRLTKVD